MFVDNPFDLVDDSCALLNQVLPEVGKLPNLSIGRVGRKNPADTVGTLSPLEPLAIIPKQLTEGICVSFVGLMRGRVFGLDNNDFGASGLLEFFKEPIVETADFDDCHVAAMLACLLDKGSEKVVNISMIGTDLTLLDHISLFVADIGIGKDKNRFHVYSPKLNSHEHLRDREVPLFPLLLTELDRLRLGNGDEEYVINRFRDRQKVSLGKPFTDIAVKAGIGRIVRPFDNMRASRSTEVHRDYGEKAESVWLGHSEKIAKECYLNVTDEDFDAAASGQKKKRTTEN